MQIWWNKLTNTKETGSVAQKSYLICFYSFLSSLYIIAKYLCATTLGASAIPDFGTHAVALWETMQHCAALHSEPQRESEGPPLYSAA